MRLFGSRRPDVAKLKRKGDLTGIRSAAGYSELRVDDAGDEWDFGVDVRLAAVDALASFYGPVVSEGLAEALADRDAEVRLAAVRGIGALGGPAAVEALIEKVVVWEEPIDAQASRLALDTLVGWRLEGVADSFAETLTAPAMPEPREGHRADLGELLAADPRGVDAPGAVANTLVAVVETYAEAERERRAETILGWLEGGAASGVVDALENGSARPGLVRAAGALGDSAALAPLLRILGDPEPTLREAAATGLGRLRDTRAVPELLSATHDSQREVRDAALRSLDEMGTAAVIVGVSILIAGDAELTAGGTTRELEDRSGGPVAPGGRADADANSALLARLGLGRRGSDPGRHG